MRAINLHWLIATTRMMWMSGWVG